MPVVGQVAGHGQNIGIGAAGQLDVLLLVELLQVQHGQVGDGHQLVEAGQPLRIIRTEGLSCSVNAGMDALLLQLGKDLRHEVHLQQRFAAAEGDAAVIPPIGAVAQELGNQVFGIPLGTATVPGLGIMAELAAQRAALQENNEPYAGAVHQAEGFQGVDIAGLLRIAHLSVPHRLIGANPCIYYTHFSANVNSGQCPHPARDWVVRLRSCYAHVELCRCLTERHGSRRASRAAGSRRATGAP